MTRITEFVLAGISLIPICYFAYWALRHGGWRDLRRPQVWPWLMVGGVGVGGALWNARRIDLIKAAQLPAASLGQARTWLTNGVIVFLIGLIVGTVAIHRARR